MKLGLELLQGKALLFSERRARTENARGDLGLPALGQDGGKHRKRMHGRKVIVQPERELEVVTDLRRRLVELA